MHDPGPDDLAADLAAAPRPSVAACCTACCSAGVSGDRASRPPPAPPAPRPPAAASCAWRIRLAQSVYSSASALQLFQRFAVGALAEAAERLLPCVHRSMIVSPDVAPARRDGARARERDASGPGGRVRRCAAARMLIAASDATLPAAPGEPDGARAREKPSAHASWL